MDGYRYCHGLDVPFDLILELLFFLSVLNTPLFSANPAPSTSSIVIRLTMVLHTYYILLVF